MYDYPDGKLLPILVATVDSAEPGPDAHDFDLGADVYFFQVRVIALADDTAVLWRGKESAADTATLTDTTASLVGLATEGEVFESPLFPANHRPPTLRTLATAGSARIEVIRVGRQ